MTENTKLTHLNEVGAAHIVDVIEERRFRPARCQHAQLDLILIDRSVYTLLAHAQALGGVTGTDFLGVVRPEVLCATVPFWRGCHSLP
jgi:hypothetical protein